MTQHSSKAFFGLGPGGGTSLKAALGFFGLLEARWEHLLAQEQTTEHTRQERLQMGPCLSAGAVPRLRGIFLQAMPSDTERGFHLGDRCVVGGRGLGAARSADSHGSHTGVESGL